MRLGVAGSGAAPPSLSARSALTPGNRRGSTGHSTRLTRQRNAATLPAYYAGKTPTPERITAALDIREMYGPEVDQALGGEEPMVDEWESGARVPTFKQMQALEMLTGFPVKFFYQPPPPPIGNGWICGSDGCYPLGVAMEDECPTCGRPR